MAFVHIADERQEGIAKYAGEDPMGIRSVRPLEDAFRIAHTQLVHWLVADVGLSLLDAYQLVSQAARSPIANVVDTNYTVLAKFPKRYLPSDLVVMGGAHERLRKLGAAHLAN